MQLSQEALSDSYFDATFDNVFYFVINNSMSLDYGNIAHDAIKVLTDQAQVIQGIEANFHIDKAKLGDLDEAEKRFEKMHSQFTEIITEYVKIFDCGMRNIG
jgi:hypothetical protein